MFNRLWDAFDKLFDAFGEDLGELERNQHKRMEALIEKAGKLQDGTTSETITEVETKPDGTVIKRTITTTRTVAKKSG